MSIPRYTPGYPPDGSSLGQTKAVIRNNLDGTFLAASVDHFNQNGQNSTSPALSAPAGYHNIVHLTPQASNPSTISGYGQLFTKTVNADQVMFYESGAGTIFQMTANQKTIGFNTTSMVNNGYAWCAGILFQWGIGNITTGSHVTGTVTFSPAFPNYCFNVSTTLIAPSSTVNSSNNSLSVVQSLAMPPTPPAGFSNTGFSWVFNGNSGTFPNFFWTAIGY